MTVEIKPNGTSCHMSCEFCVDPSTPVLLQTGVWRPIEKLKRNDSIWSFTENPNRGASYRYHKDTISKVHHLRSPAIRIILYDREMVVGENHLFRIPRWRKAKNLKPGQDLREISPLQEELPETDAYRVGYFAGISDGDSSVGDYPNHGGRYRQYVYNLAMNDVRALTRVSKYIKKPILRLPLDVRKHDCIEGVKIPCLRTRKKDAVNKIRRILADHRDNDLEWLRGWVAGMFDAEGNTTSGCVRIHQNPGLISDRVYSALRKFGFNVVREEGTSRIRGGRRELIRFYALFQPAVVRKLEKPVEGTTPLSKSKKILAVEDVGIKDLMDITVRDQHTYFAAGIPSHNCYQEPLRMSGNMTVKNKDLDTMLEVAGQQNAPFTVYGGESLLTPKPMLEKIFKFGLKHWEELPDYERERSSPNSVQTNGDLIDRDHIRMFKQYGVSVGVSIDGPDELNDFRVPRNKNIPASVTTAKTLANIKRCKEEGISVGIISTLHQKNGTPERLPRFLEWGRELGDMGINSINIHTLEIESEILRERLALTKERSIEAFLEIALWLETQSDLKWLPFAEMLDNLKGRDNKSNCIWHHCDPLTTAAVHGIEMDGGLSNCGRASKEGVAWVKADQDSYERYLCLYQTPQEYGGCKDCRFFLVCGGCCPGESLDQDWRNKTEHCDMLMALYEHYEKRLVSVRETPVSLDPKRLEMERNLIQILSGGQNCTLENLEQGTDHRDVQHGDAPHGDHTDFQGGV